MSVCLNCMESTSGTCPRHPMIAWATFRDADPGFVDQFVKAERSRIFNQTRERCAKVLDEMAEKVKREAMPIRDDAEGVLIALEAGSARIRALPMEEEKRK